MTRYTTPTLPLEVDADLSGNEVYVTLSQNSVIITKQIYDFTVDEHNVTSINVPLTQQETGQFSAVAKVQVQVNFISGAGDRGATNIQFISLFDNLLPEVISYGPEPEPNDGEG